MKGVFFPAFALKDCVLSILKVGIRFLRLYLLAYTHVLNELCEVKQEKKLYGLMGYPLIHSLSAKYFTEKFQQLGLSGRSYRLFPLDHIMQFPELIMRNPSLIGLNITVPYKIDIMNFLDQIDHQALEVGAVNTIKIRQTAGDVIVKGYNTDIYGFEVSLSGFIQEMKPKALVFGTGGAAKAVIFVLKKLGIDFLQVGRTETENVISYSALKKSIYANYLLWINTTSVGMYPDVDQKLSIDYETLTSEHFVYDLIYNPIESNLLTMALSKGASIKNGLEMLYLQADKSFEIWEDSKVK